MLRGHPIAGLAVLLGLTGCAGTWDTLTSRSMRSSPWETTKKMWSPEDPVAVLLADPPRHGNERALAMRRLKEPIETEYQRPLQPDRGDSDGGNSQSDASHGRAKGEIETGLDPITARGPGRCECLGRQHQ